MLKFSTMEEVINWGASINTSSTNYETSDKSFKDLPIYFAA